MATGFKIADAYVGVNLDRSQLNSDLAGLPAELNPTVDKIGRDAGTRLGKGIGDGVDNSHVGRVAGDAIDKELQPRVQKSGNDSGDKLSQGMQLAMVRNSPMIAAAVGGALIAGAPVMTAAAGVLFMGLAAVGAAASEDLQSTWAATSSQIFTAFQQAASVTVPFFQQALHRLADAVVGLGPQFRDMFAAMDPAIQSLTSGLIRMTQNLVPGLVAAVKSAGPVFQGLSNFLADIGSGIGQMFQILSEHSQAAGQVFSSLGSILGSLLPILGQLIGAGAEMAAAVLPPLASALGTVATVLDKIAPILPAVLTGFLAFKAVTALSGPLGALASKVENLGKVGALASTGLSKISGALPLIGGALALVGGAFEAQSQQVQAWGRALADGGSEATQAAEQIKQFQEAAYVLGTGMPGFIGDLTGYGTALNVASQSSEKAKQAAKDYYDSLSPLGKAQQDVTKSQNDYLEAVDKYGATSGQAVGAAVAYRDAQEKLKDTQGQLEKVTKDVTAAIADQAAQELAATDSSFALQRAVFQTRDAELQMKDAIKQHGAASLEAGEATLQFNQALLAQAEAEGKAAVDSSGLTDKTQQQTLSNQVVLKTLLSLKQQYGAEFPAALDTTIATLEATGVKLDDVGAKQPTPTVNLNDGPFQGIYNYVTGAINTLNGKAPTPTAFMNDQPFNGAAASMNSMLSYLAGRSVAPSATLIANTLAAENNLDYAARNRISYVTQIYRPGGSNSAYAEALGGIMMPMALGGIIPMAAGGQADIFQPNAPRILIGDNKRVRESFIPQDDSPRSKAILTETASEMGYRLTPTTGSGQANGGGSGVNNYYLTVQVNGTVDFTQPGYADKIARPIQQALVRLERSNR